MSRGEPKITPTAVTANAPSPFDEVAALADTQAAYAGHLMQRAIANTDQMLGRAIVRRARHHLDAGTEHHLAWRGVIRQWGVSSIGRDDVDLAELDMAS